MAFRTPGSTFTLGGAAQSNLVDVGFTEDGDPIDVTDLAATVKEYETGISDVELTVTVNGVSTISVGDSGAAVITWNAGGTSTITTSVCTSRNVSGNGISGATTTELTFKPEPA
jgi:hypothetical protein